MDKPNDKVRKLEVMGNPDKQVMVPLDLLHTMFHMASSQLELVLEKMVNGPANAAEEAAVDAAVAHVAASIGLAMTREQFLKMTKGTVTALAANVFPRLGRLHDCLMQAEALMTASVQQAKAMGDEAAKGAVVIMADPAEGRFMVRLDAAKGAKADSSGNIVI